ncbi:phage tail fiber protein [Metapseudomonas otitidis]|uniref:phage tail fiber domain-containing protein n=1 Tax=Metapseudomonas otitidis TaxID=319939 RepID=UPI0013F5E132|nr:phage tail fiber protein [Pseudomonas otitidis]
MAVTTVYTYDLNGSKKDFDVPFEYLARRFVQVTLIGQDRKPLDLASDFRFIGKTSIQTLKAWGPADGYERIEIRRNTSATDRLVDFADGSILRANELNTSQVQTLHVAEEARNMVADTIAANQDGDLDARGRRMVNVADPVDPYDAMNLKKARALDAAVAAAAADLASHASRASELAAKSSELAAKSSELSARGAADTVLAHIASYGANPVGTVVMALRDTLPGHLLLNGSQFDTNTYPELYAYLGTNILPDFRNRYPKGAGTEAVGTFAEGSFPSHTHTTPDHTHSGSTQSAGGHTHTVSGTTSASGDHAHTVAIRGPGGVDGYAGNRGSDRANDSWGGGSTSGAGNHTHTVSGTAADAGAHTHSVSIQPGGAGVTGAAGSGSTVEVSRGLVNFFIKAKGLAQA